MSVAAGRGSRVAGCGTLAPVSDATPRPERDVEELVPGWLSLPEVAERLGVRLADARRLVEDRELLAVRIGERRALAVPEGFLGDQGPLVALKGTFTVLADGGMDDDEIVRWLHTPDATLPVPGTPLDAIRAGFKTEVRRRAMEEAF
jgi:excisionase family DNA binding protein